TLIGGPSVMLEGKLEDLRMIDAVIVNNVGAQTKLSSVNKEGVKIPLKVGDRMELNDHKASVVGICQVSRTFQSQPVIYTTYDRATSFVPAQRKLLAFIIAHSAPGVDPEELCNRITSITGFAAYTSSQLEWVTVKYYIKYT